MIKIKTNFANCQLKTANFFYTLCLLTFTIIHQPFSIAEIRYVSHTGSNTPPYLTWKDAADSIQAAINFSSPGDTVIVANGVYYENLVIDSTITLIGSSMDSTVIDGRGLGDFTITFNASGSIENFNIYGKGKSFLTSRVIRSNTSFTVVEVKNIKISESGVALSMVGGDIIAANLLIKNITRGFNLFGEANNFLSNCIVILDNEDSYGISIGFSPNGNYFISNNIILFTGDTFTNPGYGISLGAPKRVFINNNLISGFLSNIFMDYPQDTVFINNNVLLNNTYGWPLGSITTDANYLMVRNVVFSNNKVGITGDNFVTLNYNLFWANDIDTDDLQYGDSDIVADPMFVKDTLPNPDLDFDYHLQKYSPAINSGDPDVLDVDGTRSDRGMFGGPYGESYTYQDLAPKPPANLTAIYENRGILLKWNKNTEADLSHYRIYRDTVPNFIYDISKMIGETTDTIFSDVLPESNLGKNYYYKITALDNQENQSAASEEVHIIVTGLGEIPPQIVEEYKLLNNYPNPFNPTTTIPYRLKEAGYVKVMIYNILGELVRVLVNGWQKKGYYEVDFKPDETERKRGEEGFPGMHTWHHSNYVSGVYLLRIEIIGEGNIPMFSDMKKMMLVK